MNAMETLKDSSKKYYQILNESFIKELLDINNKIGLEDTHKAIMYSKLLSSVYYREKKNDQETINESYFLNFVPYYLKKIEFQDIYKEYQYMVSFATLGLEDKRINEVRVVLSDLDLLYIDYESKNWLQILYIETLRLYLLLVRKKDGWNDIKHINYTIDKLVSIQVEKENELMDNEALSQVEIAQLVALYNAIAAIRDVCSYLTSGMPSPIEVKLSRFKDNITETFNAGVDSAFKFTIESVMKGLEIIANNSIWKRLRTGTPKDKFIESMVRESNSKPIFELLPSQVDAFKGGITNPLMSSIVIQMHTSAGKSFLAHYLIAQAMEDNKNGNIAYVVPTRALVHQVLFDLRKTFSSLNLNIVATIPAYEIDSLEEKILDANIDILVTTPEKLNLLVKSEHNCVKNLSLVVVDEAHNISDKNRGLSLEFLLATLRRQKEYIRTVLLTPFIKDNTNRELIAEWLGGERGLPVYSHWKPTRQIISIVTKYKKQDERLYKFKIQTIKPTQIDKLDEYTKVEDDNISFIGNKPSSLKSLVTKIALKYVKYGSVLILSESPFDAEAQAQDLANNVQIAQEQSPDMKILIKFVEEELGANHPLIGFLKKRIAFHHSGLPEEIKIIIENLIANGQIDYIVGTTTLAQGMNFPISTVIVKSITFPVGIRQPRQEMTPETFWNIAGRAGRVFKDFIGRIIFVADNLEKEAKIKQFLDKTSEGINSAIFETIKNLDEFSIRFNRKLIFDYPALSQFFQFISHTLKVENEIVNSDADYVLDEILRLSLAYKQLSNKGDMERKKLLNIAKRYLTSFCSYKNWSGTASLVDKTGFSSMTIDYLLSQKKNIPDFTTMTLENLSNNSDIMTELIKMIGDVPEIKLGIGGEGEFSPELVAKITQAWISGEPLTDIYNKILSKYHDNIRQSIKYIYQTITTKVSWGVGAMQTISLAGKDATSDIKNLPSMIYYGVPNDAAVMLRMAGIPRCLAIKITKEDLNSFNANNISEAKIWVESLTESKWNNYSTNSKLTGQEWKRICQIVDGK